MRRPIATVAAGGALAALGLVMVRRRLGRLRLRRGLAALRLAARGGMRYTRSAPALFASADRNRERLRNDLALQTAEDVADTLGAMKGVLMKIGQMASYVDDGLSPAVRRTLSRLQDSVPPMSADLAARVVMQELGLPPERAFARWDPVPIAAASIGQVHRAITRDGRAVAVKVQYPGIAETMAADLDNVSLLRRLLRVTAPSQDVDALVTELRDRVLEELDYRREAGNQRLLAAYYDGHPTIHIPQIVGELSGIAGDHERAVGWSALRGAHRLAPARTRPGSGDDLPVRVPEPVRAHAFNGDPHPGNYLFHGGGGSPSSISAWSSTSRLRSCGRSCRWPAALCVENQPEAFAQPWKTPGSCARTRR
jgi:predicted unusual protein kinase regulating ubiquinone biosynthesis (AarF/ABC1/UbiB family)